MYGRLATLVAITAVVVATAGCNREQGRGTGSLGEAPSTPAVTATATSDAPVTPAPESTVIQAKGFLRVEDLGNAGMVEILPSERVKDARINPCNDRLPSDDLRLARAAAYVLFRFQPDGYTPDGTAYEVITRYRSGGASAYLADLKAAVQRCPGTGAVTRSVVETNFAGDESVLVREVHTADFEGTPIESEYLVAAVRLGELIVILDGSGWEGGQVARESYDRVLAAALTRAAAA